MTGPGYPLTLDLRGRRVVVVGGGAVGTRRAMALAEAGAMVEVVAPRLSGQLAALAEQGQVVWRPRGYLAGDLTEPRRAWLVQAATDDPAVNAAVGAEAQAAGIWCVRADDVRASMAWTPAVVRGAEDTDAHGIVLAVTADGDPGRSVAVRNALRDALHSGALPVRRVRTRTREALR
ncbi:MAG TPA: NAD(P)-dependent oxidoreductase [Candidatus Lustribacter sp.]|nr:NAD(P)-dependent oxidoreductase [Candidatus Lustribacter sp.]